MKSWGIDAGIDAGIKAWLALALVWCAGAIATGQTAEASAEPEVTTERMAERRGTLFDAYAEAGRFLGAAAVMVEGEVLLDRAWGMADESWGIPAATDTRFSTASLGKHFTAAVVMTLVQEGLLDLDDPVGVHIADLREDVGAAVKVHHLLSHCSGMAREVFTDVEDIAQAHSSRELLAAINEHPLEFEPGERTAYSNAGYTLLAILVERVTGRPYAEALRERVLDPAGMRNTGVLRDGVIIERLARGYDPLLGEWIPGEHREHSNSMGSGGMYTTTGDLLRYDRALKDGLVLSGASQSLMATPKGPTRRFGFGWSLLPANDGYMMHHNGDYSGITTMFLRFPEQGIAIALLSNRTNAARGALFSEIIGILNGGVPGDPRPDAVQALCARVIELGPEVVAERVEAEGARLPNAIRLIHVGNALSRAGRDEDAYRVFRFASIAKPGAVWGHLAVGKWYEVRGETDEAIAMYRRALEADANSPHARSYLEALGVEG